MTISGRLVPALALMSLTLLASTAGAGIQTPQPAPPAQGAEPAPAPESPAAPGKRAPADPAADGRRDADRDECAWVGKRIVNLLARDDAQAALDFASVYDRFGCPNGHLTEAFGCVVNRRTTLKIDGLGGRVDQCWSDPASPPATDPVEKQPAPGEAPQQPAAPK
jgi:hypothetical protein